MWTLKYNNVIKTFEEYGINDVAFSWKNQVTDKVAFSVPSRSITEDFLFAGDIITIFHDQKNGLKELLHKLHYMVMLILKNNNMKSAVVGGI